MAKLKNRHKHKGFRFSVNSTINKIHPFYGLQKEKAGFGSMIVVLNRDEIDTNLLIVSLVEQLYCD